MTVIVIFTIATLWMATSVKANWGGSRVGSFVALTHPALNPTHHSKAPDFVGEQEPFRTEVTGEHVWLFWLTPSANPTLKTDNNELNLRPIFSFQQIVWALLRHSWKPLALLHLGRRDGCSKRSQLPRTSTTQPSLEGHWLLRLENKARTASPRVKQEGLYLQVQYRSCSFRPVTCFISNTGSPGSCCPD